MYHKSSRQFALYFQASNTTTCYFISCGKELTPSLQRYIVFFMVIIAFCYSYYNKSETSNFYLIAV